MRTLGAIGAAILAVCAFSATSHADAPGPAAASNPATPGCTCPKVKRKVVRRHVRHYRHRQAPRVAVAPGPSLPPVYYNPGIPSPYDSAYDRAMVLHFTSPPVSGLYDPDPNYPPTPPVAGVQPYRTQSGPVVMQYDGLTGEYIQLAQSDPSHAIAAAVAPAPPPPAPH